MVEAAVRTNHFLDEHTAADIDRPIARLLKDLGDPEPPLRLELVREQLRLDRHFYSSTDDGALRETIHRLRVGAKQVIGRPGLLLDVVRKWQLRALWIPDRRRILIDNELPSSKQRWGEAHEIGHSLIEWHEPLVHGDERRTLSLACEEVIEGEANYAAGRLLFMQDAFLERVRSGSPDLQLVQELSKQFANTLTSTLWRTLEALDVPAFGLISQHPRVDMIENDKPLVEYFIRSRPFQNTFRVASPASIYEALRTFCWGRRGPVGQGEVILTDLAGDQHLFRVEVFYNGHQALTLGVHKAVKGIVVAQSSLSQGAPADGVPL